MAKTRSLRSLLADYSWFIMILLGILSLILGFIGFWKNGQAVAEERTILDNLYLTLGLISLNTGAVPPPISWELQVARFMVPAVTAYTAFLAFTTVFIQQTEQVRLWFIQDQVIICGLGRKGARLASQFLAQGYPVVIVEADERNERIENLRSAGAVVIVGDAGDPELLTKVRLNKAHSLIAVAGDDGVNAEIAVLAERISRSRNKGCLTCIIHISESQLWDLLREKELQVQENSHFRLQLFNIYDRGARLMVQANPPAVDDEGGKTPRVLVIGLGKMGRSVVLEIARGWQLFQQGNKEKINLTAVDRYATQRLEGLAAQHPRLEKLVDLIPLELDIDSGEFDQIGERFLSGGECQLSLVYVCLDDETFCLQTGLRLNHQLRMHRVPIVLRMVESGGLALLIDNGQGDSQTFGNLAIFDLLDQTCTAELLQGGTHEVLARSLHGVYLASERQRGEEAGENGSLTEWEELSDELRETNRQLADRIPLLLAEAGCRITPLSDWDAEKLEFKKDQTERMARMEHESWLKNKLEDGWRFGAEKDAAKKTNPALVSWGELPEAEREKNRAFVRGLPRLLAQAGFQVERF